MTKIKQLEINEQGNLTLEGRVVEAKIIDTPFIVEMKKADLHDLVEVFERTIEQDYVLPEEADAYLRSNHFIRKYWDSDYSHFVAVQLYKIQEKK